MYACQECGKKFKSTGAAERALNNGCPKCGGSDIDLDVSSLIEQRREAIARREKKIYFNRYPQPA